MKNTFPVSGSEGSFAWLRIAAAAVFLGAAAALPGQGVIYQQNFANSTGSNRTLVDVGWAAYSGATASSSVTNVVFLGSGVGNPNTNAGYLAFVMTPGVYAAVGTFAGLDVTGSTVSWTMGNSLVSSTVQLLVQVNGSWYASTSVFSNSGYTASTFASASAGTVTQSLTLSADAAGWRAFTLTPGTAMSLGATRTDDLELSSITGLGFFVTDTAASGSGHTARLDSLAITAVPEPAVTVVLFAVSAAIAGLGRRRRWRPAGARAAGATSLAAGFRAAESPISRTP